MRVAFSGSHRTGKTSLVSELSTRLTNYTCLDEPYHILEDEGFAFSDPPSLDDFVAQLERSLKLLHEAGPNVLLDRAPVDMVAYLLCHPDSSGFDLNQWLPDVKAAMTRLDIVVFLQVDTVGKDWDSQEHDFDGNRRQVDQTLRELLLDDSMNLNLSVMCVHGELNTRADTVMQAIEAKGLPFASSG